MKKLPHFNKDKFIAYIDPGCYVPLILSVTCNIPTAYLANAITLGSDSFTTLQLCGSFSLPVTLITSCFLNRPLKGACSLSLSLCHIIPCYYLHSQSPSHATPVLPITSHSVLWDKLSPPASPCSWTPLPITFIYLLKSIFVLSPVMPHRNIIHHINSATSWQMSHFSLYSSITLNDDSYNSTFLSTVTFLLH